MDDTLETFGKALLGATEIRDMNKIKRLRSL
jgi:hypothetical protein